MQPVNEQDANDSVIIIISSGSPQQQQFGLRKGHPYDLSQTPNSSTPDTALCHQECRSVCRESLQTYCKRNCGTALPKQPIELPSGQGYFLFRVRIHLFSAGQTCIINAQAHLPSQRTSNPFLYCRPVINYLCFNNQKKFG